MCLSSKAGMRRRDATRGTFLVKHLSRGFLRVHSVSILWKLCLQCSLCAICNLHCVWIPTQHFSPAAHPSHWPLSNYFLDNLASSHRPLQSVSLSKDWLLLKITSQDVAQNSTSAFDLKPALVALNEREYPLLIWKKVSQCSSTGKYGTC